MEWMKNSLHWCHRMFWYSFAVFAILLAIAISLIRIFITDVKDYRQEIESFASSVLEQDVRIDSMEAQLSGFTPLIVFNGVQLLDSSGQRQLVKFEQARLTIDPLRSLSNFKIVPKSFTVYGVSLGVHRQKDGTFQIQGLNLDELGGQFTLKSDGIAGGSGELADWLFKRSDLAIKNSTVIWQDEAHETKTIKFENVNFYIRNDDERHQLTGTVTLPPELGQDFEIAFDFNGNLLNPVEWQGHFFSKGKSLHIQNWGDKPVVLDTQLQTGTVDLSMWGEWQAGTVQSFTADFTARELQAAIGTPAQLLKVDQIGGLLDWKKKTNGWTLNMNRFQYHGASGAWPESKLTIDYAQDEKGVQQVNGYASYFRLHDASDLISRSQILQENIQSKILALNPQGEIENLVIHSTLDEQSPKYRLSGKLHNISIAPVGKFPGIRNFSGELTANEQRGHARILAHQGDLSLPTLLREPVALNTLDAQLDWWRDEQQWIVKTSNVQLSNDDISGSLSALVLMPDVDASPYLDIQLEYVNGNGTSVHKYLPVTIMDKQLVTWLDHAFKAGTVSKGGFVFNGRLADFPFKERQGMMLADFYTNDVLLDYQPGWPLVMANEGHLMVTGLGLEVMARQGTLFDSELKNVHIILEDFALPRLDINGSFSGQTRDLFHYLVNSPIASEAAGIYRHAKITGEVVGKLALQIPLSQKAHDLLPLDYTGEASLKNSRLDLWDNKLVVENISGDVTYKPKRITSRGLKATLLQQDVAMKLFSRSNKQSDEIQLTMRGKLDAGKLRHHIASPLMEEISGITDWQGVLSLGTHFTDGRTLPGYVHINSALLGLVSGLPAPLSKSAGISRQLKLEIGFPKQDVLPVYASVGADLSSALAISLKSDKNVVLQKGSVVFRSEPARLPKKDQLLIKGSIASLPVSQWRALLKRDTANHAVNLLDPKLPIHLDMDFLKLETAPSDSISEVSDPGQVSLVNGEIRQLDYNEVKLGKVNISTSREADGIRIENLSVAGENLALSGEGRWSIREGKQLTNMLFKVTSGNFEALLDDLGYSATIRKGSLQSVIQAHWYDAPTNFSLATLNADIGVVISDGVISEVRPGAGRLLGLLSLSELPRRLQLDFDEFRNGLAFSQIVGQVAISNGIARIETLNVISPVALMRIDGSTNLVKKTFEQSVRVVPNLSGTVPFVSWLALGGQVGALAFLLDQIFGDTFDESIGTDYEVTGTWEEPVIRKLQSDVQTNAPQTDSDIYE